MKISDAINKSLFFSGAGFSFEAGCKTSNKMLDDLNRRICDSEDETFTDVEKLTISFLLSCLEYHSKWRSLEGNNKQRFTPNIEELALLIRRIKNRENVLPYPITGNWADKLVQLEAEYEKNKSNSSVRENLYESIENKLKENCLPDWLSIERIDHLNPLIKFLESLPDEDFRLKFFTLNNDLLLDKSFGGEIPPFTGFHSEVGKNYKKWIGFDSKSSKGISDRIDLYKLHGSINWFRGNDEKPYELENYESIESFLEINGEEEYDLEAIYYPFIIFGHGVKFFSVEPFFSLINAFHEYLRARKYYFIIGYSFFDPYINNLIFEELHRDPNEEKKLIIISPELASGYLPNEKSGSDGFVKKFGFDILEEKWNKQFVNFFKDVQNNNFYSDLPEFNIKTISDKAIYYIRATTGNFLENALADNGKIFIKMLKEFEKEEQDEF
jgi:hypothetical protein